MALMPAAVIDGATTKAEQIRGITSLAARRETSIVRSGDLKVVQTASASGSIVIMPGQAVIDGGAYGPLAGAYLVTNDAAVTVAVPAPGSTARTYYVMLAIRDPQYPGMPIPTDRLTDKYVDVLVQTAPPADRPYILLAKLNVPANSTTVTTAMIADARAFPLARTFNDKSMRFPAANINMSKTYVSWPLSDFAPSVPTWANYIKAAAFIPGIEYTGADTGVAGLRLVWDKAPGQNVIMQAKGQSRQAGIVLGEWAITAAQRGDTAVYLGIQGAQTAGTGNFQLDYQSGVLIDWTFYEVP